MCYELVGNLMSIKMINLIIMMISSLLFYHCKKKVMTNVRSCVRRKVKISIIALHSLTIKINCGISRNSQIVTEIEATKKK